MTTQAHPPARPLRKDAARNRELLIVAARELFARRGLDVSLSEQALTAEDPWQALIGFFEAAVEVQVGDRGLREVFLGVQDTGQIEYVHDRMTVIVTELARRAQRAGVLRKDAATADIGMIITMMGAVTEITGEFAPDTWRRYLALCLEGLKPGAAKLPLPGLTEQQLRARSPRRSAAAGRRPPAS